MPFLPVLPELGAAGAVFLLIGLVLGVVALIRAIGLALGTFHVGPVSIPIGKWFMAIASPVVSLLEMAATALWAPLGILLRAAAWIWTETFDAIKSVLGVHAAQIAHLHNVTIPDQGRAATHSSTSYTASEISTLQRAVTAARADLTHLAAADSAAEYAKAERSIATVHHELVAMNATAIRTAERYADAHIRKLSGELAHEIAGLRAKVGVANPPAAVPVTAPVTVPQPVAGTDLSTQVGVNTAAIATTAAAVAALTREYENCAVRTCAGPNNLQNLLSDILGFASLAEIATFLQAIINNPAAAEARYAGEFQGRVAPFVTGGGDVWGALEQVLGL